jgi:putative IMPACT (imprinted ancient) family translation regulator
VNQFQTIKAENNFDRISVIEEKKSKFIGSAFYVQTETEVKELLNTTRKNNRGANHYCYAYRIVIDEQTLEKSSDDGEPTGTAGIQILNGIKTENLYNVLIIVTRYFGGTLLGT